MLTAFVKAQEVVVSDITSVKTDEGTHCLSLVMDDYSRRILGYELSNEMKASDVVKALDRRTNVATIHHSDRDRQYCSSEYQEKLNANGRFYQRSTMKEFIVLVKYV